MKSLVHIAFICFFWGNCQAQFPQNFLFRYVTNENQNNGLSQTTNHFIFKDSKGFVWISSMAGLNRFDGKNVKIYEEIIGDSTSLQGQFVQGKFCEDGQNNIWFTTYKALHYYNRKADNFQHFHIKNSLGTAVPGFYNCGMDGSGQLWLIHQDSLLLFNTKKKLFTNSIYLGNKILRGELFLDTYGRVVHFYAFTPGRSELWQLTNPMSNFATKKKFFTNKTEGISAITIEDSLIWIGTNKGLVKLNPSSGSNFLFTDEEVGVVDQILGITNYSDQHLAISSRERGLLFFNKNTLRFDPQTDPSMMTSSKGPIYKSLDDGLWLAIEGKGLAYTYPQEIKFNNYLRSNAKGSQRKQISFNKLLDASNGEIWAATYSNGIYVLNQKTKNVVRQITKTVHPEIGSDSIIYLFKDNQNRIWILTWGGLSYYSLESKEFRAISRDHIFLYGQQGSNGKIQLCSYSRNGIWEIEDNHSMRRIDPHTNTKYTFLYEDKNQLLYAARDLASLELFKLDSILHPITSISLNGDFKAAYEDSDDNSSIWFATTYGLIRLNRNTYDFNTYSRKDGLPSSTIYSIISDDKENYWLSTNTGISCFNPYSLECQNYGLMEGISALEFNSFSYLKRSNGEIWYGSTDGLTTFIPEQIYSTVPPKVEITEIFINDEIMRELRCRKTEATNPGELREIQLLYTQNTISFSFAALEYAHPENVRLFYRMEGLDSKWIKAKQDGFVRYSKLSPGEYSFKVKATTSMDSWSETSRLSVTINPPFYHTWWFFSLIFLTFSFASFLIYNYRENQKLKLNAELEKQRNDFAQDMHDELGSSISSLKLAIELLMNTITSAEMRRRLEKIAFASQSLYQKLREVIWSVNSRYDTLENLILYLHKYASETFEESKIDYQFNIPVSIPRFTVLGKSRSNILFSYKEALNNIIRHSNASKISIEFTIKLKTFEITIYDNGKGIPQSFLANSPGNGLENMQRRLHEIGGVCKITSNSNGTTILFSTKINNPSPK